MESDLLYLHPLQVTYEEVPAKLHSITSIWGPRWHSG